jgi:HAD superfamily phosphoserine phosphatase-like hydrolase
MRLVLFDIDGTLITGPSTEKRFFWLLALRGLIGPRQVFAWVLFLLKHAPRFGSQVLKKNKAYLSGLRLEELRLLARPWAEDLVKHAGFEPCLTWLRHHRIVGDRVVLLSGTPQFVAEAIGAALGIETICGTHCAERDGRLLPLPPLAHPFGPDKARIAAAIAHRQRLPLRDAVAYADSIHDLSLFCAVGTAVAVRPDATLADVAETAGWKLIGPTRRGLRSLLPRLAPRRELRPRPNQIS